MDKLRIFEIAIDDIIIDPQLSSVRLNDTLNRGSVRRCVAGMSGNSSHILLSLMPCSDCQPPACYRFAELSTFNKDEMAAAVMSRYYAGFTTIGSFATENSIWGLFSRDDGDFEKK